MVNLAAGNCVACRKGEPALSDAEIEDLLLHVPHWKVREVAGMKRLERVFPFKDFAQEERPHSFPYPGSLRQHR